MNTCNSSALDRIRQVFYNDCESFSLRSTIFPIWLWEDDCWCYSQMTGWLTAWIWCVCVFNALTRVCDRVGKYPCFFYIKGAEGVVASITKLNRLFTVCKNILNQTILAQRNNPFWALNLSISSYIQFRFFICDFFVTYKTHLRLFFGSGNFSHWFGILCTKEKKSDWREKRNVRIAWEYRIKQKAHDIQVDENNFHGNRLWYN